MSGLEVEFKYAAEDISLDAFLSFCEISGEGEYKDAAGYDTFFKSHTNNEFLRYRKGPDVNQLTYKRKLQADNYVRIEWNLDLSPSMTLTEVEGFCTDLGYTYNVQIFKQSFVYVFDWYIAAYYICYDSNMKELNRFIELEVKEGSTDKDPYNELLVLEKLYKSLGLAPDKRIAKSLFELYRKE